MELLFLGIIYSVFIKTDTILIREMSAIWKVIIRP